ncbi:hypothetical protein os1_21700 [Comamonadaceae bacterium OS-1]|nr:hypothetical protein os1_21700 [Comamonadaceae bacterium OS-1]
MDAGNLRLVLGDFAENPSTAAMVANGAIGLIPVVDQLLDVRDIVGVIVRCSRKGWAMLDDNDKADLAFAALGCVPEVGSFIKGSVKPLFKHRKESHRGVQAGLAMVERTLGMAKGGAICAGLIPPDTSIGGIHLDEKYDQEAKTDIQRGVQAASRADDSRAGLERD